MSEFKMWSGSVALALVLLAIIGGVIYGTFWIADSIAGPVDTTTIHRYHARCLNYGSVVWEGDFIRRGISIWSYTPEGKELFLPHDGCVTVER